VAFRQGICRGKTALRSSGVAELEFDLRSAGETALEHPVVPVELLGVLRTATQRAVTFDRASERFEMARGGYRGFRLYAHSIDDVPGCTTGLKIRGMEVIAEVEAIERIQVLDRGLTRLFWLIACWDFLAARPCWWPVCTRPWSVGGAIWGCSGCWALRAGTFFSFPLSRGS
jgi:hypothetical protein